MSLLARFAFAFLLATTLVPQAPAVAELKRFVDNPSRNLLLVEKDASVGGFEAATCQVEATGESVRGAIKRRLLRSHHGRHRAECRARPQPGSAP